MLNENNQTLLKGRILIRDILNCFQGAMPDSIILGGSCVDGENNISQIHGGQYYLSDIDLLCIREKPYGDDEADRIFNNMLMLSTSLKQNNPYFHIGLKLRGRDQLKDEVGSMYFRELSENSVCLRGSDFLTYFQPDTVFGFFSGTQADKLNSTLFACGMTRLWCNVLFYPAILLKEDIQGQYRIWYNYFYARGCLDWITFKLISEGEWIQGYKNRYLTWERIVGVSNSEKKIMTACLETKLGNGNTDYRSIFSFTLDIACGFCDRISASIDTNHYEFDFIVSMNRYMESQILNDLVLAKKSINVARKSFVNLCGFNVIHNQNLNYTWLKLRELYSEFRFNRSPQDRIDHQVYTNFFMGLSNNSSV